MKLIPPCHRDVLHVYSLTLSIPILLAQFTVNSQNPMSQTSTSASQSAINPTVNFAVNLIPTSVTSVIKVNFYIKEDALIPVQRLHTFSTMNALIAILSVKHALTKTPAHLVKYKATNRYNCRFANAHLRLHFTPPNASRNVHISMPLLIKSAIEYALEVSSQ